MEVFGILLVASLTILFASFAISFEAGIVAILIVLASAVVTSWVLSFMAKRQLDILVGAPPTAVAEAVRQHFSGIGWKTVDGRGAFNYRSRGIGIGSYGMANPVISIDVEDVGNGTEVNIWMSEGSRRMGIVASCDRVVSKRWTLSRKLAALGSGVDVGR